MSLEKTYQIDKPPEPAMVWEEYQQLILSEWDHLLNGEHSPTEAEVHIYLEKHPSMLPGAFNLVGDPSGHYPWLCGLISQPILPAYDYKKPDFMWLSQNSDTIEPVLIEIESPNKRWFTKAGVQTAELTQAINQIAEWKTWFGETHNVEAFKSFYGLAHSRKRFRPSYLIIYGRRIEFKDKPNLTGKRSNLFADNIKEMTYDRLRPNRDMSQLVCMKVMKYNTEYIFKAISVPATLQWSPGLASDRAFLHNLDDAINSNDYISQIRKEFLIQRLPYWNEWSRNQGRGIIHSGDKE